MNAHYSIKICSGRFLQKVALTVGVLGVLQIVNRHFCKKREK